MTGGALPARPSVGVFRLQLFKPSETFITAQAEALERHDPIYIGRRRFGPGPAGAQVVSLGPGPWASLRLMLLRDPAPLVAALGHRRIELVHAHFAIDAVYARRLARRLHVPLVTTLHGFDVNRRRRSMLASLKPALIHGVLGWRALMRDGALFLGVSRAVVGVALARGAPRDRLRRLEVGVDLDRLRPSDTFEPGLIVHVGRLVEKKGTAILLEAMARLAVRAPQARLVVIGDGPLRRRLQAQAGRLGLGDRVTWLGALDHEAVLAWLARAAIVAVPSRIARNGDAEGLPTVVLEAAALGRPIVASDTGGVAEAVRDGISALLVPPGEVERLAQALARLLADPALGARLGAAARRGIEQDYDLAAQTRRLEACYDALRTPPAPADTDTDADTGWARAFR